MFTRLLRLSLFLLLASLPSLAHQGGTHPPNVTECEDIELAIEWLYLTGDGVERVGSLDPLLPHQYKIYNDQEEGDLPSATVKLAFALGANHVTTYSDFERTVTIGNSRTYTSGTQWVIDPLIDGWAGTLTLHMKHKTCDFTMTAHAHWAFEDPFREGTHTQCGKCQNLTCDGRGEIKSIDVGIPVGPIRHGSESIEINYLSEQIENEGASKLSTAGHVGTHAASVTTENDVLTSVTSGNHLARIQTTPTVNDPEKIQVDVSYDKNDPDNTIFRTSTLESFATPIPEFVYTDTVDGRTTTRTFQKPTSDTWILNENDLRRTSKTKLSETPDHRSYRFTTEEYDTANNWIIVEQRDEEETNYQWGWTLTQRILDPLGAAITTDWDYYEHTEFSGPNSDTNGRGKLQSVTFPTGLVRTNFYYDDDPLDPAFDQVHITTEAFAGNPGGKETRIHSRWEWPLMHQKRETFLDGHLVDVVDSTASSISNYRIETRYPSNGGPAQVTRYDADANANSRFFSKVTNPDGTVVVTNKQVFTGQMKTSVFKGVFNSQSKSTPIITGTAETRTVNTAGQEIQTSRRVVRNAIQSIVELRQVTSLDHLDRPLTYDVFHGAQPNPSHTETIAYGCCGISERTGSDGITTYSYYDDLGRNVKTHRNGLASETIYDGLTTRVHTYPEATPSGLSLANPANQSGFVTRNLVGQTVAQGTRSPQDNSLQATTTVTTYAPAADLGMRIVTTAPQTADDLGVIPSTTEDFYLDGLPASTKGPLVTDQQVTYTANPTGLVRTTARLDASGTPYEPVTTQHNWLGHAITVTYAGDADGNSLPDQTITEFDPGGRPSKITDPDGVTTLFTYDFLNAITTVARDLNNDGTINTGTDEVRISAGGHFFNTNDDLILWNEERLHDGAERTLTRSETRSDGLETWTTAYNNTVPALTHTLTTSLGPGDWDTVSTLPNNNQSIQRFRAGLLDNDEARDATGNTLATRSFTYDSLHRVSNVTNSSGPDLQTTFVSTQLDLIASRTLGTQTTSFTYDHRGRVTELDAPDSLDASGAAVDNRRFTSYFPHGAIRETTGTPGYHLSYTYDDAFRLQTLTTYGTSTAVTRWNYNADRGWLSAKFHNSPTPGSGSGPSFTYTAAGRPDTRLSERGITTSYNHSPDGRLAATTYSDGTPAVTILDRDLRGRITRISDAGGERTLAYDDFDAPTSTTYDPGHILAGWSVPQTRDPLGRLTALTLSHGGTDHHHLDYSYDQASRLDSVQGNNLAAYYHYNPTNQRVAQLSIANETQPLLYATRTHDNLNRLSRLTYHNGDVHAQFERYSDTQLQRDNFGHLTSATRADGTQWRFGYNPTGELTTANLHSDHTSPDHVLGHSLAWTYDGIGNRSNAKAGGDSTGASQHQQTYTPNALNQYTSRTNPGLAEIFGEAPLSTEVLVNNTPAARQGPFFHAQVPVDNSTTPVWQTITVQHDGDTTTGHLPIPRATTVPTHDADGNLLANDLWQFTWDAENRLTQAESTAAATAAGAPYQRITYLYDATNRRLRRQVFDTPSAPTPVESTRFLYAGWRCLGEIDDLNSLTRSMAWGLDNNDTLHLGDPNAALLWIHDHATNQTHLPTYDHNGNITSLLSAQTQQPTAQYAYSPFGQLLTSTGPYAESNPYKFSTQYQDPTTQLINYGHRHLNPQTGRWLSRDPIEESGGLNLYGFVGNDPTESTDALGLALYAFDGTGNTYNQQTHIGILHRFYQGTREYEIGVGTQNRGPLDNKAVGGLSGAGGQARLASMYAKFRRNFANGDEVVDIIGFSRGAALARAFANMLNEEGFVDPITGECRQVKIRFIGLFDTVASFGIAGTDVNLGYNLDIPPNVETVAHAMAMDEKRGQFPLTRLNKPRPDQNFFEAPFPGDHSDNGGGHIEFKNGEWVSDNRMLSKAPLNFILQLGRRSGVPFGDVPKRNLKNSYKPHDMSTSASGILGPLLIAPPWVPAIRHRNLSPNWTTWK